MTPNAHTQTHSPGDSSDTGGGSTQALRRRLVCGMTGVGLMTMLPALVIASPPHGRGHGAGGHGGGSPQGANSGSAALNLPSAGISASDARGLVVALDVDKGAYKPLPPGIRRNLARGKPLPPGIAKRTAPSELVARLPEHPGHEWQVVGSDLVLIDILTAIIADVLLDVF